MKQLVPQSHQQGPHGRFALGLSQVQAALTAEPVVNKFMLKRPGFTLVELLIVISIIAILSVIGIVSYTNFMKSSRDAKRQSDLKLIQSALEEYHADQIYYPLIGTGDCPSLGDGRFKVGCALTNTTGAKTYLTKVPNDPIANPDYLYKPLPSACNNTSTNCVGYCLYANMEITDPTSDNDNICGPFSDNSDNYDYGITRP